MSRRDVLAIIERTSRKVDTAPTVPAAALVRRRRRDGRMTIGEAHAIAGHLGHPSKMPGYSYGLHAKRCHVGAQMAKVPGSICAGCFALKGFYATWWPALVARDRHHAGLEHPQWVEAMVTLINHYCLPHAAAATDEEWRGVPFFRWHDSGDIQSVEHLGRIVEVCERTPEVRHWLPTRQYRWVAEHRRLRGPFPGNLVVRLSALMIDAEPPRVDDPRMVLRLPDGVDPFDLMIPAELDDLPTSTVHTAIPPVTGKGAIVCRAIDARENQCGPCRACWDGRVRNVSYPQH